MKIVEIWARGYANQDGLVQIQIEDHQNPAVEARKHCGMAATVYHVRDANLPKSTEVISEEYARMMSKNDNS